VLGVLVGLEGKLQGEVYRLFDGESKLGRGEQCQVVLLSDRISREHALVMHQDGHFAIKPLSERNPTIVNGARVEGVELKDGDYLKLGDDTFRFRAV
jgi:pSer/pThr/pTyr-binding forkhead associated (FHA) protein